MDKQQSTKEQDLLEIVDGDYAHLAYLKLWLMANTNLKPKYRVCDVRYAYNRIYKKRKS